MKKTTRFITLTLLLTFMLSLAATSLAQTNQYCFDLDEDDCELHQTLSNKSELPESSTVSINIDGTAEADSEEVEFAFMIDGTYILNTDALEEAQESIENTPILEANANTFLTYIDGILSGFDAELEVDYRFPQEMGIPQIGPFNLYLVDGVGYFDFTPLNAFDPSLQGVYGLSLVDTIRYFLKDVTLGDLFDGMDGSFDNGYGMQNQQDNPFMNGFNAGANLTEEDIASFYNIERVDDETVNGVDVVVFVSTVDLPAVFAVDEIAAQAYESAVQSGMSDDISQEDFAEAMTEALAGSTITITEKYDEETNYTMQTAVVMDLTFDTAPLAALTDEESDGTVSAHIEFDMAYDNINNVNEIELPDNAEELSIEELINSEQ